MDGSVTDAGELPDAHDFLDARDSPDAPEFDAAEPRDAHVVDDASSPDAELESDSGSVVDAAPDACAAPVCPPPPPECSYFGATACSCGSLECPPTTGPCEGPGTMPCRATDYCAYPTGTCGGAGTCTPFPDACSGTSMPVCGCDGVTYTNACEAAGNEQSVAFDGECPPLPDCRTVGCPGGESCQTCLGLEGLTHVCLPDGTIC